VLIVGIGVLLGRQLFGALGRRARLGELAVLALLLTALALTFTRAAFVAVALGTGSVLWFAPPRLRRLGIGMGVAVLLAAMAVAPVRERLLSAVAAGADAERAAIWSQAVVLLDEHPLVPVSATTPCSVPAATPRPSRAQPAENLCPLPVLVRLGGVWPRGGARLRGGLGPGDRHRLAVAVAHRAGDRSGGGGGLCIAAIALWTVGLAHDVLYHPAVAQVVFGMAGLGLASLDETSEKI